MAKKGATSGDAPEKAKRPKHVLRPATVLKPVVIGAVALVVVNAALTFALGPK